MTDSLFCHFCRVHHPKKQMRRHAAPAGARWRNIEGAALQFESRRP